MGRLFGNLKVRPKLMILHNVFFLVLTCAVYYSLIPAFEQRMGAAREREVALVARVFDNAPGLLRSSDLAMYEFAEGTAVQLAVPREALHWLDSHLGEVWWKPAESDLMYRKEVNGMFRRARAPAGFYDAITRRARLTLFAVLGIIYIAAVAMLELLIMPQYVYGPIRRIMAADHATQHGDREHEMIAGDDILDDEIGQIMRSRNAAVAELRRHEDALEETAADLKRKNQMLESHDRLVSLGLLSASVAHELNTPLSVLHGSIEKLMETLRDKPTLDRLARMLRVTERLRRISEGLLDFARSRQQHMEPVAVRPLVEESWGLLGIDEKAGDVCFANFVGEDDAVVGNADRLVQVFVNLLRNALHAVGRGGRIEVRSERLAGDDGREMVAIRVEDDGAGIPPEVLDEIFEAFVSTRLDARGTGLGLTVAEGIVHQHHGAIRASNREGGGARLEVRLPAAPAPVRTTNG